MDVGLRGGNGGGNLRQRAGPVRHVSMEMTTLCVAVLLAGDVPAHVDPGDIGIVQLDQRVGMDGIDHDRRVGPQDADQPVAGHHALGRDLHLGRKSSCASAALAFGPVMLPAGHAEAEHVGVAQREPAIGLVGHGQVEPSSCAA